jgi:iron complex transport system ATP-binding protein
MVLELRKVTFKFDKKKILKDVSLHFNQSSINAIIGPNGAGKTTFLRIISGLLLPDSGDMMIDNKKITEFSYIQRAKVISYLSQFPSYNKEETLLEMAKKGDYPYKRLPPPPRPFSERKKIAEVFLDLKNLWDRKLGSLSGGEIQRGLIARVIIQDTPIVLFDEPTNHLDLTYRLKLFQLFDRLRSEGKIIIYAIHDFNISLRFKHNIFILSKEGMLKQFKDDSQLIDALKETYGVDFDFAKISDFSIFYPKNENGG